MENLTPGEIQERFNDLWDKVKAGTATPEQYQEMLRLQEKYWANPESQGSLYNDL
jgi:hypothetical protein